MPKIIITTDGKTTTAKLYRQGEKTVKAIAKCDPRDEFDFLQGAEIALERLRFNEAICKPKVKPGDFVIVNTVKGPYEHSFAKFSTVKVIKVIDNFHIECEGYINGTLKRVFQTVHPNDITKVSVNGKIPF